TLTSGAVTLLANSSIGIYTPLYAWNNQQLKTISVAGAGTSASPYLAMNVTHTYINSLFASINDYGFETFVGVLIANTNATFDMFYMPPLLSEYAMPLAQLYQSFYNIPLIDSLGYELYNTTNISIYGASLVSGSLASFYVAGFPDADMMVWNSTHDLIASSVFYAEEGISLLVYNPSNVRANNVIWGNWFTNASLEYGMGIYMASSGNLVFNNYFGDTPGSNVLTPASDPYTGLPVTYKDTWNISYEPTTYAYNFNGFALKGSIINSNYVGGNFWNDLEKYPGTLNSLIPYLPPYNESGNIAYGGDFYPLSNGVGNTGYFPVIFVESGALPGTEWWVDLAGLTKNTTGSAIVFYALPGNYSYMAGSSSGMLIASNGTVTVGGYSQGLPIGSVRDLVIEPVYTVTLTESGLPAGYTWVFGVLDIQTNAEAFYLSSFNNATTNSIEIPAGFYQFLYSPAGYYYPYFVETSSYHGGNFEAEVGANMTIPISFVPINQTLTIDEYGLAPGATWSATVWMELNGTSQLIGNFSSSLPFLSLSVVDAVYEVQVYAPGYIAEPSSQSFVLEGSSSLDFQFIGIYTVTFGVSGVMAGAQWTVTVGGLNNGYEASTTSTSPAAILNLPDGVYYYSITSSGYTSYSGSFVVDNAPLTVSASLSPLPSTQYTVTFSETGLASGSSWQVTFNGNTQTATAGQTISFTVTAGSYYYSAYSTGMSSPQSPGYLNVQKSTSVSLQFVANTYNVTVVQAGLPSGTSWSVTFNGQPVTTSASAIVLHSSSGPFTLTISPVKGYRTTVSNVTGTLTGNTIIVVQYVAVKPSAPSSSITANLGFDVLFLVIGLVAGAAAIYAYMRRRKS
ncbi:MAG: hypothetical protein QXP70_02920, partial [Methanomassiliicoccales archaeon]